MTAAASRLVDLGRAAYEAGTESFQAWAEANIPILSLTEWQTLLLNIVGWSKPLLPEQRQFLNQSLTIQDLHRHILVLLLQKEQIESAEVFAKAICQPDHVYFISPADVKTIFLNAVGQINNPKHQVRLCEFILSFDSQNIPALIYLLEDAIDRQNEFAAMIYCQALLECVDSGLSFRKEAIQGLLFKLYSLQYFDSFFAIGAAFAKLHSLSEQPEIYSALALIALHYNPDIVENFSGLWNYEALIRDDKATEIIIGAQAYLPAQEQLTLIADHTVDDDILQLELYGCTVKFQGIGGYFHALKENLKKIGSLWPPDRLEKMANDSPVTIYKVCDQLLFRYVFLMNYITDELALIRPYQNQVARLFSGACQKIYGEMGIPSQRYDSSLRKESLGRPLKVGYLSHTFRRHSVGFISVESLGFHDQLSVQSYLYNFDEDRQDSVTEAFARNAYIYRHIGRETFQKMVEIIREDQLDVLIYLDALTSHKGEDLVSLKLAPIQVVWLGGDSPGIPEIDYFLVDQHLLPEDAQRFYPEKLIRLPTFVAVSSFDVLSDEPKRFRTVLGIPEEAVIYVTAAIGYKRNTEWIECQLEIIRQVPHAYLIVKGIGDLGYMTQQFQAMADQFGIGERIRFLTYAKSEESHRGQMSFMDVMLDTFPYTGATHTLECLWLGVPVLTCFGEHYYSRMSYTMLQTIGEMDPCIAHSPAEYVAKGVALGLDAELRCRIKQRLWQTRHSSILWDPYRHAKTLEMVYRQMVAGTIQEWPQWDWLDEMGVEEEETAAAWNQRGITLFRQGQSASDPQQRLGCYQRARECWRLGLVRDPHFLPCVVNRVLILWYLGHAQPSWQAAARLVEELWGLGADLEPWDPGSPLESALIWIPSYNECCPDWRSRYLHLLYRWQIDYFSVITNFDVERLWAQALALNPQDRDACLVVGVNHLYHRRAQGVFHLYQVQDHPRAQQALALATKPSPRDPQRPLEVPRPWIDYRGMRLFVEPQLDSVGTAALLARGDWFEGELQWLQQYLQPGMNVIDVGANVGVYTFAAAGWVGATGQVWAIEPTPSCVACLQETVAVNGLTQVQVVAAAAGDESKTVTLRADKSSVFNQVISESQPSFELTGLPYRVKPDRTQVQVPQITLDTLWQEQGSPPIHLIKIDTEGAELKVLQGSQALIAACQPVLIVEIVGQNDTDATAPLAEWLQEQGYDLFVYLQGLQQLRPVHPQSLEQINAWSLYSVFNLVALPAHRSNFGVDYRS